MDYEIKKDEDAGKRLKCPCSNCHNETHHEVLSSIKKSGGILENEDLLWWEEAKFQVIQCLGCEEVSFRREYSDMDYSYQHDDTPLVEIYPPRSVNRKLLDTPHLLPLEIRSVYFETHKALCSEQPILAGMGIRTLTEAVCRNKEAVGGNLEHKIDNLVEKGFLSAQGAKILHFVRLRGNEAAHEIKAHDKRVLDAAMSVVEHLLTGVYLLDGLTQDPIDLGI